MSDPAPIVLPGAEYVAPCLACKTTTQLATEARRQRRRLRLRQLLRLSTGRRATTQRGPRIMLKFVTSYKVVHISLVVVALVVVLLRNHGLVSTADVDAIVASLATFGVGLNVNLSSNDRTAVVQASSEAATVAGAPAAVDAPAQSA